jgi:hypothetical protein
LQRFIVNACKSGAKKRRHASASFIECLKSRYLPVSVSVPTVDPAFALHVLPHSGADRLTRLAARACGAPIAVVVALEGGEAVFSSGTGFSPQEREGLVACAKPRWKHHPASRSCRRAARPTSCFTGACRWHGKTARCWAHWSLWTRWRATSAPNRKKISKRWQALPPGSWTRSTITHLQATHQTEEDAQRLATRLGITLESITEGFYTLDTQWRFSYLNREGARLLGRPASELL